ALQNRFLTLSRFQLLLADACPLLSQVLIQIASYPDEASPASWAELFTQRLIACGFPGPHALNSETFQVYQRMLDLLQGFKTLTYIQPILSKQAALYAFQKMTQQTIFQAEQTAHA